MRIAAPTDERHACQLGGLLINGAGWGTWLSDGVIVGDDIKMAAVADSSVLWPVLRRQKYPRPGHRHTATHVQLSKHCCRRCASCGEHTPFLSGGGRAGGAQGQPPPPSRWWIAGPRLFLSCCCVYGVTPVETLDRQAGVRRAAGLPRGKASSCTACIS